MGTTDISFVLHRLINHFINTDTRLYCAFIDFSKAHDYVKRTSLWLKLIGLRIRGKRINIMRAMYQNVR